MTTIKKYIDKYGNKIADEYNENKNLIKRTYYQFDGKTVLYMYIKKYDKNKNLIQEMFYDDEGTVENITEYTNGQKTKETEYQDDGKTISVIFEYNSDGTIKN